MPSRLGGRHGHCLLPHEARLCVARSTLVTVFLQCFGLLRDSVKIFFACGGLRVRRHSTWLPRCCLPAADRVVWLSFGRYVFCFSSVACCGVVESSRGICSGMCVCLCGAVDTGQPVSARLSAPRGLAAACRATAALAALFACRRLLPPRLHTRRVRVPPAAFCGCSLDRRDELAAARVHGVFPRISLFGPSKREKKSGLAGRTALPKARVSTADTSKSAKGRVLVEPADRLLSCSRSKKSVI